MPSPRLLIVDDDHDLLLALPATIQLRLPHALVETASSGAEALQKIDVADYDAIVTDVKMPGMDGLTLMKEIQRRHPHIPTLLITGHGEHDLAVQALRHGAYAFLPKPLDREILVAWLVRAIELRELTRELEESEQRFRLLADAAFEAIALSEKGKILDVNTSFLELFGYSREEVIEKAPAEFHAAASREVVARMNLSGDPTRYEAVCLRKDGSTFPAEIRGRAVPYKGRRIRVTAIHPLRSAPSPTAG